MAKASELAKLNSLEETRDYIIEEMKKQGEACVDPVNNSCKYRNNGKACIFGKIIPDEMYDESLEHDSAEGILTNYYDDSSNCTFIDDFGSKRCNEVREKLREWYKENMPFVIPNYGYFMELQKIHDCLAFYEKQLDFGEEIEKRVMLVKLPE